MQISLKTIKTLLYSYSALHVSGTLAPIIRSLPNSAHTASNHRVSLGWLCLPATNPTTQGDWRLYVQNWEAPDDGRKSARNM
jgi:hypothetical protein